MGIDYSAKLFFGFLLPEDFYNSLEAYDGDWETWLAEKLDVKCCTPEYGKAVDDLGAVIYDVFFFEDVQHYLIIPDTSKCGGYAPVVFDTIPTITQEMLDKFKAGCEKLGFEYTDPHWNLCVSVW